MKINFSEIEFMIRIKLYKFIGKGSGRKVYDLGNGYVVKVGKNKKGIAQNEEEFNIGSNANNRIFAKVISASPNFRYLIMEKCEKVNKITLVWDYFKVKNNKELFQIEILKDISNKYNLIIEDFGRASNWGTLNDRPIIIDYGFTRRVCRKYY